jgi:hypothetical protein
MNGLFSSKNLFQIISKNEKRKISKTKGIGPSLHDD